MLHGAAQLPVNGLAVTVTISFASSLHLSTRTLPTVCLHRARRLLIDALYRITRALACGGWLRAWKCSHSRDSDTTIGTIARSPDDLSTTRRTFFPRIHGYRYYLLATTTHIHPRTSPFSRRSPFLLSTLPTPAMPTKPRFLRSQLGSSGSAPTRSLLLDAGLCCSSSTCVLLTHCPRPHRRLEHRSYVVRCNVVAVVWRIFCRVSCLGAW
ncbi:hypothetical protein C8F01DRAFT_741170 [Mycena amicta]|nr:hypothetical protein C8F01DRAFT_741170 [Mycena amicta]